MKKIITILFVVWLNPGFSAETDCNNPVTTIDTNACKYEELKEAEKLLDKYLESSKQQHKHEKKVLALIERSQQQWLKYRETHCDAIYQLWTGGTIRGVMHGQCMLDVTRRRTHELWQSYLTYVDSTPPVLPEPNRDHTSY